VWDKAAPSYDRQIAFVERVLLADGTWWASHNVRLHRTSTKQRHHPVVGEFELTGEALALPGDTGLIIITYTVEPHSASADALDFLASWAAGSSTEASGSLHPANGERGPPGSPWRR
jgi:hypothetical protein